MFYTLQPVVTCIWKFVIDAREALLPIIVGHMISHIENKMPSNGYRSDESGNIGCLQCIGKVQEILHSGDTLVCKYLLGIINSIFVLSILTLLILKMPHLFYCHYSNSVTHSRNQEIH